MFGNSFKKYHRKVYRKDNSESNPKVKFAPKPNYKYLKKFTTSDEAYDYCVDKIYENKRNNTFYIGVTCNPARRLEEHIEKKNKWNMFVLCSIPTKDETVNLENRLIRTFKTHPKKENKEQYGGRGIVNEYNYIYLLM